MFETQLEYQTFLTWARNGSTVEQRMQQGHRLKIPPHWEEFKPFVNRFPETLESFMRQEWISEEEEEDDGGATVSSTTN